MPSQVYCHRFHRHRRHYPRRAWLSHGGGHALSPLNRGHFAETGMLPHPLSPEAHRETGCELHNPTGSSRCWSTLTRPKRERDHTSQRAPTPAFTQLAKDGSLRAVCRAVSVGDLDHPRAAPDRLLRSPTTADMFHVKRAWRRFASMTTRPHSRPPTRHRIRGHNRVASGSVG